MAASTAPVALTLPRPLHVRWLGRVRYQDAWALQHGLFDEAVDDHLLLLEHPHVYTLGVRADPAHVLVDPASVGAELVPTDRGGDVTYHGPGQLVGYPILHLPGKGGGDKPDTVAYVHGVEQLIIDTLADLGLAADRLDGYPGVWVDVDGPTPRKIARSACGSPVAARSTASRLNVDPDLAMFDHIVPCGIPDKAVTSLRAEGIDVTMREVVDAVVARAVERWGAGGHDRADVVWRHRDSDLAPFSRGDGPGEPAGAVRPQEPAAVPVPDPTAVAEGRRSASSAAGRGRRRPGHRDRRAQARRGCGPRRASATSTSR